MLKFCGFDIELQIDSALERRLEQPPVWSATDESGRTWLIVEAACDGDEMSWLCAPVSRRVIDLVASGRATAFDAVRHSHTGWVEVVRVIGGRSVPDRRVACSELTAEGLMAAV